MGDIAGKKARISVQAEKDFICVFRANGFTFLQFEKAEGSFGSFGLEGVGASTAEGTGPAVLGVCR